MSNYISSTEETPINIINVEELEGRVEARMEPGAFHSIRGGAGNEKTLQRNITAFDDIGIISRTLQDIESASQKTSIFGIDIDYPIITSPVAAQELLHVNGEKDGMKGTNLAGSIYVASTYTNFTIDEIRQANPDGNLFFQLYMSKRDDFNDWMIDKAVKNGAKAIVLTCDAVLGGNREWDNRLKFQFPVSFGNLAEFYQEDSGVGLGIATIFAMAKQNLALENIKYIKERSGGLPVIIKGVQYPEDALAAIEAGADGIWVSNHGGRQLEGGPAAIELLPEVAKAVNKRVPIIFDSGIRRGQHIFKAIASGADIVAIGRPAVYGLNLGGAQGVQSVYEQLGKELNIIMMLTGCKSIEDIKTKGKLTNLK